MESREVFVKGLMYFCMLNLVYYTECLFLFLKFNSSRGYSELSSLIIMVVATLIYIFVFIMFKVDPDPFDYFRYAFRKTKLAMSHEYFYILAIISSVLILGLLPKVTWASMIPFGILLIYTLIYRPYRDCS